MEVSFYEEFPNQENLRKLDLIDFPTKIILAAPTLKKFLKLKQKILSKNNVKEVIYWPTLKKEDGYWFSPFSKKQALKKTIDELEKYGENLSIMWDAEFPVLTKSLFLTEFLNFFYNRSLIKKFFKNTKHKIITSEYPVSGFFSNLFLKTFALRFKNNESIPMYYSSMIKSNFLKKRILKYIKKSNQKKVALGCIATGILGNEPLLNPEQLGNDLKTVKNLGIEEIIIFRLAGLNKEFVDTIKKHL